MIPRYYLKQHVIDALKRQAVVALLGPRQVGKTTLSLEVAKAFNAIYLDLEDPSDRIKLTTPKLFFEQHEDELIVLDEIHRLPEVFDTLRGVVDKGRRDNKGKGRFLILGSASIDLLKQSSESLAGRITHIDMTPFTMNEVDNLEQLWLRGGFPDSYLAETNQESMFLRQDFIRTYLERDIPMFGPRVPATTMRRLWTMLAHAQGTLINSASLARSLEVSTTSVNRYIDLLCDLLLVRRLQPYHANVSKRLIKSPKVYVRDSGLVHALLGLESYDSLLGHPVVGNSWEGFVVENILSVLPWNTQAFFYRTAAGAEIDLLLEFPDKRLWAIEVKRSLTPKPSKGFYQACEDLKPEKSFVVYGGNEKYLLSEEIEVISLQKALSILSEK